MKKIFILLIAIIILIAATSVVSAANIVSLPALNFQNKDDVCRSWVSVQNLGAQTDGAVFIAFGEQGPCLPQANGPLEIINSGSIVPGATWNIFENQIPEGANSGIVVPFPRQAINLQTQLPELNPGIIFANNLFLGVIGNEKNYIIFINEFLAGEWEFGGYRFIWEEDQHIEAKVLRHCPGDITQGVKSSSSYMGISFETDILADKKTQQTPYTQYINLAYADKAGFNSIVYIQNIGDNCASVTLYFQTQDSCLRDKYCSTPDLAPGETYPFDVNDCVGPQWKGSIELTSTQPIGVVTDIYGRDVLMTYEGFPKNDEIITNEIWGDVLFAPNNANEYQGWDSGVQVFNNGESSIAVKVYFLDNAGGIKNVQVDEICPEGTQTFFLPVIHNLPGNWFGGIVIVNLNPKIADIAATITNIKYSDTQRTETREAVAYNAYTEHELQNTLGVGLPLFIKDLEGTRTTSEVLLWNPSLFPGELTATIDIYGMNSLINQICEFENFKHSEYIDLQTWNYFNDGFLGSAVVQIQDKTDMTQTKAVLEIERTKTILGEDIPGDETAGTHGVLITWPYFNFAPSVECWPDLSQWSGGSGMSGIWQFLGNNEADVTVHDTTNNFAYVKDPYKNPSYIVKN